MYTSYVGKRLLKLLNDKEKKHLTPREFFDREFWPSFYNHKKYMQWITNSPFVQGYKTKSPPDAADRNGRLAALHKKIKELSPDASFAIGYCAAELTATTSGQISTINLPFAVEDIYASWIGSGLGIGVQGGQVLLIDDEEVLLTLHRGWKKYRELLNQTPHTKGNQIDTWNGRWITHAFGVRDPAKDSFIPFETGKEGIASIPTQSWIRVLFTLARQFPQRTLMAYVYNLGQTNTTIGFVQLNLPEVRREIDMYEQLFGEQGGLKRPAIDEVYDTEFSFMRVCQMGVIGLRAIQPKDIRDFIQSRASELPTRKKDDRTQIKYNIYISWIIAMLNNKDLLDLAAQAAKALSAYEDRVPGGRSDRAAKRKKVHEASNRREFIDALTKIIDEDSTDAEIYNRLVHEVMTSVAVENFRLFTSLIHFKYAFLNK